jgi:uridine kinase
LSQALIELGMVTGYIERKLLEKSKHHRAALKGLEVGFDSEPLSEKAIILKQTPQIKGMSTILQDIDTSSEDFIFYFDRISCLLIEQ